MEITEEEREKVWRSLLDDLRQAVFQQFPSMWGMVRLEEPEKKK